jgi:glycosyltransferase involved in cell wall biosynthesis
MKVSIIAGSLPPQVCGVGDFAAGLINALRDRGVTVSVVHQPQWRLRDVPGLVRRLRAEQPDIVHLQYPMHGFRRSLVPHLLHLGLAGRPRLTALHDYAGQRWPVRLGMSVFTVGGRLVVTGDLDRAAVVRRHPWTGRRVSVIPIGSNIPGGAWQPSGPFTIVHFGMLRPQKGIEDTIRLAELCRRHDRPYRTVIIGAIVPHAREYAESLFRMAEGTGVEWRLNATPQQVSETLRQAHVAYLAPPCGVHERRGTLLAAASNGLPIVAKVDWETPAFLRDYVIPAATPDGALEAIDALADDPVRLRAQGNRSVALARLFSWTAIADQYIAAMQSALPRGANRHEASRHEASRHEANRHEADRHTDIAARGPDPDPNQAPVMTAGGHAGQGL